MNADATPQHGATTEFDPVANAGMGNEKVEREPDQKRVQQLWATVVLGQESGGQGNHNTNHDAG